MGVSWIITIVGYDNHVTKIAADAHTAATGEHDIKDDPNTIAVAEKVAKALDYGFRFPGFKNPELGDG